jgi:hypothetical protein
MAADERQEAGDRPEMEMTWRWNGFVELELNIEVVFS